MMVRVKYWFLFAVLGALGFAGGCNPVPPPNGPLEAVQPTSSRPRLGSVYIVRGLFGNFSTGMDELQEDLEAAGVRAVVYQHLQSWQLADTIAQQYHGRKQAEPLVLVGHSLGADSVVEIAKTLEAQKIPVNLLVTVDAVYADPVPPNVQHAANFFRSMGPLDLIPALRGIPIKWRKDASGPLENINLREHTELTNPLTNHFTIDSNPKVRQAIVQRVLAVCAPRTGPQSAGIGAAARLPTTRPLAGRTPWLQGSR